MRKRGHYLDRVTSEIAKNTDPLEVSASNRKRWKLARTKNGEKIIYKIIEGDPDHIPMTLEGEYYDL